MCLLGEGRLWASILQLGYIDTPRVNFLIVTVSSISQQVPKSHPIVDDESNVLTLATKPTPTPVKTTWTLLLYLTSPATGCKGGETVFYPEELPGKPSLLEKEIVVGLETGMLLLHKHGNDCMLVSSLPSSIYVSILTQSSMKVEK